MNRTTGWWKKMGGFAVFTAALAISGASNANLVQNGDFNNQSSTIGPIVPNNYFANANVADWFLAGAQAFVIIYAPGGGDNTSNGAPLHLWGPGTGSQNGLPETSPFNPGTNYLAADADPSFVPAPNSINQHIQVISGQSYMLNFDYAAAQYTDETGNTQDAWQVSLGGTVVGGVVTGGTVLTGPGSSTLNGKITTTPVLSILSEGFSTWMQDSVTFTATAAEATSGLLSFLAVSPNAALPPVVLLDSVSIVPAPEPGSLALLGVGVAGLAGVGLIRRRRC
jgi:hypothetical protein